VGTGGAERGERGEGFPSRSRAVTAQDSCLAHCIGNDRMLVRLVNSDIPLSYSIQFAILLLLG